jgi:uncharacterized membrane protein HdeD (DUF308 family)
MGIVAVILGALFLTHPAETSVWVTFVVGFWFMLSGIMNLFLLFVDRTQWGWKLFSGVLGLLAGFIVVDAATETPLLASLGLGAVYVFLIGIWGIMIGGADLIRAFQGAGWGVGIIGALSLLFGFFLVFNPLAGAIALPVVFGVLGIALGIVAIIAAFRLHAT